MSFQVSIWACYEVVTETTPSVPTASSPSTTSVVSTSSVYTSAPSSSSSYTGSTSSSSPYTSTPSSSSVHTGSTSSSPTYTSSMSLSSTSSSPSVHTPSTSSEFATVCEVSEGMDEPQFIPKKNIRDDDGEKIEDDVEMLRPDSKRPFSVDKRRKRIVFRIWFMPAVRLASIKLINPKNVDSITVWYIKPSTKTSKERPVVEDGSPTSVVRFPDMPEAVDVIIQINRKDPNEDMKFRISVKACFKEATETTPYSTSSSSSATTSIPSSVPSSTSSLSSSSSVYTSSPSTSVSTSGVPSTSVYLTPTTVCTVDEGMDEPKFIPDRNIRDNDNRPIKDADNLRPRNNNPFTVDRNTVTIRFVFNPAIPVESLKMIRPNNVDSITVTYISPRNSRPKPVVEDEKPQKLVRFPQQPYAVEVVIKVTRDDRNEPMSFQVSIWACFEVVTETTPSVPTASSPSTTSVTSSSPYTQTGPVSTSSVYTSTSSSGSVYTGSTSSSSSVYTSTTSSAACIISRGMDSHSDIPDKNIKTNDKNVNEKINRLRPEHRNPARSHKPNFKVTIDLPADGVPIDRVTLPDNNNIKAVKVYYTPEGRNSLLPINDDKPVPADEPVKMPRGVPITRVVILVVQKYIEEDAIRITVQIWGCFVPGTTTEYITTPSMYSSVSVPCDAESMVDKSIYLPKDSLETNDKSLDIDSLFPGKPNGPAKSYLKNLKITIKFSGGAALDKLQMPTHANILTIQIMILLPGESNLIPYMGGVAIRVTDEPIQLPSGIMASQVIIIVIEKLVPSQPIFITINIWACFDIITTPGFTSSTGSTPLACEQKLLDYESDDVVTGGSSQMPAATTVMALKGSDAFWSPRKGDKEASPFVFFQIKAKDNRASVYQVSFTARFSKSVIITLFNKKDKNVDTSDKIKCDIPLHHKHITYNFYGQTGDKIYIYVQPVKKSPPQISNVQIRACFEEEMVISTPAPYTSSTTLEYCEFTCDGGDTCLSENKVCDGNCDCYDCADEDCATPPTPDGGWSSWSPWSKCNCQGTKTRVRRCDNPRPRNGGKYCKGNSAETIDCDRPDKCDKCDKGYAPVMEDGEVVTCGGFVNEKCPKKNDTCTLYPRSTLGTCCRPIDFWTPWGEWSSCSQTCGDGVETRSRTCTSKNQIRDCTENNMDSRKCNEGDCRVTPTPYYSTSGTPSGPDGEWSSWSPWSRCSRSCGEGEETRYRRCNDPAPGPGGKPCKGADDQSRKCKKKDCQGPPNWSPWSPWGECDVHCGTGMRARTRACDSPAPGPGQENCPGLYSDTKICTERPCECTFTMSGFESIFGYEPSNQIGWVESDGTYGPTSPEEDVYVDDTFEDGVVVHVDCSNCTCDEGLIDCKLGECEECTYSKWTEWGECSKSCDVGQRERTRRLRNNSSRRPSKCKPVVTDRQDCNLDPCPTDVPPEWNPWSPWGDCTPDRPCTFGTRQRNRMCSVQPNTNCYGDSIETKPCENPCTSTPSQCGNGMVWSECGNRCPHTCIDVRLGTCTEDDDDECVPGCTCPDGKVLYDGECVPERKCPCYDEDGNAVLPGFEVNIGPCETCVCRNGEMDCNKEPDCCEWETWGPWGECSDTCGEATRNRYRVLLNGDPYSCGEKVDTGECPRKPCPADCKIRGVPYHIGDVTKEEGCEVCHCTTQGEQCENDTHAIVDGNWSDWSEWSTCSRSCDGGVTNRYRQCNDPLPQCGGAPCKGRNSDTKPCNNDVSCCEVTAWSQWSECSATCDRGTRTRERAYKSQADTSVCDKVLQETETCLEHECDMKCNVSQWSEWSDCSEDCGIGRKTRTRNVRGPKFPDCPDLTDSAVCYEKSCRCGPNEEFSNHTLCEHTCANRFDGPPADCEEKLKDGCICEDDYYRDENGDCVKMNECDKCYVDGEYKKPGETWTSGENGCSACECIAGAVKCSPVCEIPTCEEDETLSYEGPNPCCPRCVKRTDSCRRYTRKDFLQDSAHKCRSVSKIDFSYCEGSCGNSTSMPMLFSKPNNNMLDNDCRCCTADVSHYDEVNVLCGEGMNQSLKTAFVPVIVGCRCQPCQEVTENPIVKGR